MRPVRYIVNAMYAKIQRSVLLYLLYDQPTCVGYLGITAGKDSGTSYERNSEKQVCKEDSLFTK